MKRIYLMRHTQSGHGSVMSSDDHGRSLSEIGIMDARNMADYLIKKHKKPCMALVSDSKRTMETWENFKKNDAYSNIKEQKDADLYLCDRHYMLEAIQGLDDDCEAAIIIAHYPAIQECAISFTSKDPNNLATALSGVYSSGTLVVLDIDCEKWADITTHSAILQDYIPPENLR